MWSRSSCAKKREHLHNFSGTFSIEMHNYSEHFLLPILTNLLSFTPFYTTTLTFFLYLNTTTSIFFNYFYTTTLLHNYSEASLIMSLRNSYPTFGMDLDNYLDGFGQLFGSAFPSNIINIRAAGAGDRELGCIRIDVSFSFPSVSPFPSPSSSPPLS